MTLPAPPEQVEAHMAEALDLAKKAAAMGEVPVGAVVVHEGKVVGRGHNRREVDQDPLAHAELLALREAAKSLGRWRLSGCTLYCTLEPCPMCAGALVNARVDAVVFGASDPKAGAVKTLYPLCSDDRLNHQLEVFAGVKAEPAADLLKDFFRALRKRGIPSVEDNPS
jgi:tRNA(adenine34) deaminase